MESAPLTCWVLDHPAHMQLFSRWILAGRANDLLVVTRRPETEALLATKEGHLPDRKVLLVKRPAGLGLLPLGRELRAWNRVRMVRARLKQQRLIGYPIERVVSKGAPLELLAAKREGVGSRWYISDCEPNHLAHRLALNSATDVVLPSSWRVDLDRGFLDAVQERSHIRLHRLSGELPHCYLSEPHRSAREEDSLPRILYRKLVGGGIHDSGEHISAEPLLADLGMQVLTVAENDPVKDPWGLPSMLAEFDGVLSESVTLAHEAIVQGVPALLVSAAKRGVLDSYAGGSLLHQLDVPPRRGMALTAVVSAWREAVNNGMHSPQTAPPWNSAAAELTALIG